MMPSTAAVMQPSNRGGPCEVAPVFSLPPQSGGGGGSARSAEPGGGKYGLFVRV
jgi:hypothetical protein